MCIRDRIFTFSLPSGIRIFATYPYTSYAIYIPTSSWVVKSRVLLSVEIYNQRDIEHPPEQARHQAAPHRPPSHSTKKYHPASSSMIDAKQDSYRRQSGHRHINVLGKGCGKEAHHSVATHVTQPIRTTTLATTTNHSRQRNDSLSRHMYNSGKHLSLIHI